MVPFEAPKVKRRKARHKWTCRWCHTEIKKGEGHYQVKGVGRVHEECLAAIQGVRRWAPHLSWQWWLNYVNKRGCPCARMKRANARQRCSQCLRRSI